MATMAGRSLLFLAVVAAGITAPQSPRADEAGIDWDKLLAGTVLVDAVKNDDDIPGVRAIFTVNAPDERIWATLVDYDHFTQIFDGIDRMRVLSEDEDGARVEFWIDAVLKKYHYVLYRDYQDRPSRLSWSRVSGDMKRIEGSWEILETPEPAKRLLIYRSHVKVGGLVPTRLVRWGAMRKATDMALRLRAWIERDGEPPLD